MTNTLRELLQSRLQNSFLHISLLGRLVWHTKALEIPSFKRRTLELSRWHLPMSSLISSLATRACRYCNTCQHLW
jgi:hypothetical protein